MKGEFSFYLEKNNNLFLGDVLAICYKATSEEMKQYGLTSNNVVLFVKCCDLNTIQDSCDFNYLEKIKDWFKEKDIILRIQSECFLGMYGDSHCDCESQRIKSIEIISKNDGIFIHLPQEAQGWGLFYKLRELDLQVSGRKDGEYIGKKDRDSAQKILLDVNSFHDNRGYVIVYQILKELGLENKNFILITDSDKKILSLRDLGMNVIKYDNYLKQDVNYENVSEYLIKIENSSHTFDDAIIDKIIEIISSRRYNERTLSVLINIVDRINSDLTYSLSDKSKKKFLKVYRDIICGEEKRYILGDEKNVKIQNNFSCRVDSSIFKSICKIYGKNIFDRISLEKIYYFKNKSNDESIRIRSSYILDAVDGICKMFKGQMHVQQSLYEEKRKKVIQKEISISRLRSFFENPDYNYVKRVEMVTIISENVIPGINIYIKKIPNIENRVMDIYGKRDDIERFIGKMLEINGGALLNNITDLQLSEQNFSEFNLRFADLNSVVEEELNMYSLTKEEEKNGVRSKILLP